jgi:hypothetical protein
LEIINNASELNIAFRENICNNKVIHKVRKTQHQNPEFGHTEGGEIFFLKTAKKYISIQGGMKLKKPSILVENHQFWW